jgi:hypothetical protein
MPIHVNTKRQLRNAKGAHLRCRIEAEPHVLHGRDAKPELLLCEPTEVRNHRWLRNERVLPTSWHPVDVLIHSSR